LKDWFFTGSAKKIAKKELKNRQKEFSDTQG